jgi:hypothetical protein
MLGLMESRVVLMEAPFSFIRNSFRLLILHDNVGCVVVVSISCLIVVVIVNSAEMLRSPHVSVYTAWLHVISLVPTLLGFNLVYYIVLNGIVNVTCTGSCMCLNHVHIFGFVVITPGS